MQKKNSAVIPAKAGIQAVNLFLKRKLKTWIPAFAGMTGFLLLFTPNISSAATFPLKNSGTEFPVTYEKFGTFSGVGTNDYKFKITDRKGLAAAMGEGLYPNNGASMMADPAFVAWNKTKTPHLNPWDNVQTGNPQEDFFAWAQATSVSPGTKLFYMAQALVEGGHIKQALKAYHSILVNFPREAVWSSDHSFVWYAAGEALSKIEGLTKQHPEIGVRLKEGVFKVTNGNDVDLENDIFVINPGHWATHVAGKAVNLSTLKIIETRGKGKVKLVRYENKHWQLLVQGAPYFIHGVTYHPTEVGKDLSDGHGNDWMRTDQNEDGVIDGPYQSWVDENRNGLQDSDETAVGDFKLLQKMGANTIRFYRFSKEMEYNSSEFDKKLLRDMTKKYGLMAIMGDFLGAYTVGSGASWEEGTDYTDAKQRASMKKLVRAYVLDHKDEPYVLMWLLGNENLMGADYSGVNATRTNASTHVKDYLSFVNEVAMMIHKLDPNHPVAVGNLGLNNLEEHAMYAPAIDIYGTNRYTGSMGFGDLWKKVQNDFDRPVLITEFGCDAYNSQTKKEDEEAQASVHRGAWNDIYLNRGGGPEEGNSIGGVVFEFLDEWWKSQSGSWTNHDENNDSAMAFPDGWSSEEWLGLVSQGEGTASPFLRQPRKVYFLYRDELWKKKL